MPPNTVQNLHDQIAYPADAKTEKTYRLVAALWQ